MRTEKQLLVKEIERHLDKSAYVFFTDFSRITVSDVSSLRKTLRAENGEFHVVKKTLLKKAADEKSLPMPENGFEGQIAMIVGGKNPSGVAKLLKEFRKNSKNEKLAMRGGMLDGKLLSLADIEALSSLPGMEVLRAQLLSLLITPAFRLVRVVNAVPQSMLNVLQAREKQNE
ncbi:MAG: 50S ribosomal protein L10 [Puniceicoccales bacterium]|jgi:large subunit ribosomal protein L10|nr:50S ribosomal protein L10 [Puniceicoccales bacterium]